MSNYSDIASSMIGIKHLPQSRNGFVSGAKLDDIIADYVGNFTHGDSDMINATYRIMAYFRKYYWRCSLYNNPTTFIHVRRFTESIMKWCADFMHIEVTKDMCKDVSKLLKTSSSYIDRKEYSEYLKYVSDYDYQHMDINDRISTDNALGFLMLESDHYESNKSYTLWSDYVASRFHDTSYPGFKPTAIWLRRDVTLKDLFGYSFNVKKFKKSNLSDYDIARNVYGDNATREDALYVDFLVEYNPLYFIEDASVIQTDEVTVQMIRDTRCNNDSIEVCAFNTHVNNVSQDNRYLYIPAYSIYTWLEKKLNMPIKDVVYERSTRFFYLKDILKDLGFKILGNWDQTIIIDEYLNDAEVVIQYHKLVTELLEFIGINSNLITTDDVRKYVLGDPDKIDMAYDKILNNNVVLDDNKCINYELPAVLITKGSHLESHLKEYVLCNVPILLNPYGQKMSIYLQVVNMMHARDIATMSIIARGLDAKYWSDNNLWLPVKDPTDYPILLGFNDNCVPKPLLTK